MCGMRGPQGLHLSAPERTWCRGAKWRGQMMVKITHSKDYSVIHCTSAVPTLLLLLFFCCGWKLCVKASLGRTPRAVKPGTRPARGSSAPARSACWGLAGRRERAVAALRSRRERAAPTRAPADAYLRGRRRERAAQRVQTKSRIFGFPRPDVNRVSSEMSHEFPAPGFEFCKAVQSTRGCGERTLVPERRLAARDLPRGRRGRRERGLQVGQVEAGALERPGALGTPRWPEAPGLVGDGTARCAYAGQVPRRPRAALPCDRPGCTGQDAGPQSPVCACPPPSPPPPARRSGACPRPHQLLYSGRRAGAAQMQARQGGAEDWPRLVPLR